MPYLTVGKENSGDMRSIIRTGETGSLWSSAKVYKGDPHGMCTTLKDKVNEELLAFFKS